MKRLFVALIAGLLPAFFLMPSVQTSHADSATWKTSPATGDWNHAANWTPPTIPNGPLDTATFASSNTRGVSISANTEVDGIVFNAGASAFTITAGPTLTLTVSGAGITNISGITQNFVTAGGPSGGIGQISFFNSATAGSGTVFTNNGPTGSGAGFGHTEFFGISTAGNGTFINNGTAVSGVGGGFTEFNDSSTAANGTFINNGGTGNGQGGDGATVFNDTSTAGNGTFINNSVPVGKAPSFIGFFGSSTAGSATFTNSGGVLFSRSFTSDASSADNATFMNNGGANGASAGDVSFFGGSTAANGIFTSKGGQDSGAEGSQIEFSDASTADNGTFTLEGGAVSGTFGAVATFNQSSTAGNGTFTINGGAVSGANGGIVLFRRTNFFGTKCTAGNATLIANGGLGGGGGGSIQFFDDSSGGHARVEVFGNGFLDISGHNAPGVSIGSIQGSGLVFLGALNLTIGSNNLSTNFSGLIEDGGNGGGSGGSLRKVGGGTLVLHNSNAYTGGTTINGGKLEVNNESGSGTGSGPVQVKSGRLGGRGIIAGDVTLGDGSGGGAILSPGKSANTRGTLVIVSTLAFNSDATYKFELSSDTRKADGVIANGVMINSGAQFSFADVGNGALPLGTVFTAITNTSANPIAGTFSNLADSSTFTSNGNTYQVSYEGGDGNDLTLTVVP